jgi:hypothetical protein
MACSLADLALVEAEGQRVHVEVVLAKIGRRSINGTSRGHDGMKEALPRRCRAIEKSGGLVAPVRSP